MKYELKNCRTGEEAVYKTEFEVFENGDKLTFVFDAEHSQGYCCRSGYNKIHSMGDVFELLIGTDPERKVYYEIELSPRAELMIAEMTNKGDDEKGNPMLDINFVEVPFVEAKVEKTEAGYHAEMSFDKKNINSGDGEIYFNAYRIETDGGTPEKHLFALSPTMKGKFHVPAKFVWLKDFV